MDRIALSSFRREADGAWTCIEPVEFMLCARRIQVAPGTRFTRGTTFMGVDVAEMLDAARERRPRS